MTQKTYTQKTYIERRKLVVNGSSMALNIPRFWVKYSDVMAVDIYLDKDGNLFLMRAENEN